MIAVGIFHKTVWESQSEKISKGLNEWRETVAVSVNTYSRWQEQQMQRP